MNSKYNLEKILIKNLAILEAKYSPVPKYDSIMIYYKEDSEGMFLDIINESVELSTISEYWHEILEKGYRWIDLRIVGILDKKMYIYISHSNPCEIPKNEITDRIMLCPPVCNPNQVEKLFWNIDLKLHRIVKENNEYVYEV